MRPVAREELLDFVTYEERRAEIRAHVMRVKDARRIHAGDVLTFLFENRDTVRYQVQEMMRAERMVREADIRHELETYNELLGGDGALGCTLMIEIDDPAQRAVRLRAWLALPRRLYVKLDDGARVRPTFDPRQIGDDRLSAVQFLKFDTGGRAPVAIGSDLPQLVVEAPLSDAQRAALTADLADK